MTSMAERLQAMESSRQFASSYTPVFMEEAEFFIHAARSLNLAFLKALSALAQASKESRIRRHFGMDADSLSLLTGLIFEEYIKLAVGTVVLPRLMRGELERLPGIAKEYRLTKTFVFQNEPVSDFFHQYMRTLKTAADRDPHKAAVVFRLDEEAVRLVCEASDKDIYIFSIVHEPQFECALSHEDLAEIFAQNGTFIPWNYAMIINRVLAERIPEKILFNNTVTSRVLASLLSTNVLTRAKPRVEEFIDKNRFAMLIDLGVRFSWASHISQNSMAQSAWLRDMKKLGLIQDSDNDRYFIHKLDAFQHLSLTAFSLLFLSFLQFKETEPRFSENFAFAYLFFKNSFQKDFESLYAEREQVIRDELAASGKPQLTDADLDNRIRFNPTTLFKLAFLLIGGHLKSRRASTDFPYAEFTRSGMDYYGTAGIRDNHDGALAPAQCPHCGAYYLAASDVASGKTCPFCGSKAIASAQSKGTAAAPFAYFDVMRRLRGRSEADSAKSDAGASEEERPQ